MKKPLSADETLDVSIAELDGIASLHCDKWLEGAGLHMTRYAGALLAPALQQQPAKRKVLEKFRIINNKSFSGDMSGTIGEALFAFLLIKRFGLSDLDFAHFGASSSTGLFPDFGIHRISPALQTTFAKYAISGKNLTSVELIPAEVKAMTNPDNTIVRERLDKAIQQVRNFWQIRKLTDENGRPLERGASIIFMALRNRDRLGYDGTILWMG